MKQNTDYGFEIQKTYLEIMLSDAQTYVRCQAVFDPQNFDRRLQQSAEFIKGFVEEHTQYPPCITTTKVCAKCLFIAYGT